MKKILSTLFVTFCLCTSIFPAETKIIKDAKTAIKKYAGYKELQKRGFTLNQLDNIQTAQDFYEVLLPYMIRDSKPLDNLLTINEMDFARHKNIIFENIYGKKEKLIKKGYSEEQIFYYPAAGKDFYRVGNFEWGKLPEIPNIWNDIHFYKRPFLSKDTAYFWVLVTTEKMFEPYYKKLESKKNIILDFRMHSGGWGNQVHNLGTYLEGKKYKGKIIIITDRTTKYEDFIEYETKTGTWNNGVQEKGNLNWIVIGENSFGVQKYITNADWNYKTDDFHFSPLPLKTNNYAVCEEGVGVFPDVWAVGDEDILKTLEFLTGDKEIRNLVKNPFDWRNKLIGKKHFFYNENWQIPKQISNCKSDDEYNVQITDWLKTKLLWKEFLSNNENLKTIGGWWFELPACFNSIKDVKEYNDAFAKWIKIRIDWAELLSQNSENLKTMGNWWFNLPECFNSIKDAKEYNDAFAKWIEIRTDWTELLLQNSETLKTMGGWWFDLPACFNSIKDAKEYNDAFAKWIEIRTDWTKLLLQNKDELKATGGWWLEPPEAMTKINNPQNYLRTFETYINLESWWSTFLITHQPALHINSLKIYKNDLDELFPERNDPDIYFAQLDSYLKDQSLWIDYLMPQPLVIPSSESYKKAEKYKGLSQKIGKNCSSVPEKIRNIQKSNPEEYVYQMVSYINSVAENDFEKVQMVFSIEQEILRYDNDEYKKMVEKINIAKNGVGEDYDTYSKNLNKLWKDSGEEHKKQDWKSVLEEGICVCDGYSQLMQWFCYKLGIKNRRIFTPHDMFFAVGHSWNIVRIEGEDYPLDATWGLSYLYMKPDEFYSRGHFPQEPEEQLLEKPHTLEEYKAVYNK
ncbi:MAG: hypothetical protein MJ182_09575 [Treponema sp.]|nr:hypothetical protein [Treponema sp.]